MSETAKQELRNCWYGLEDYPMNADESMALFLERNIVIPRSELPKVQEGPHEGYARTVTSGDTYESAFHERHPDAPASTPEWHRNHARHHLALAEWLEAYKAKEATANAARDKRRDELASELWPDTGRYGPLSVFARNAIDRIIALEASK